MLKTLIKGFGRSVVLLSMVNFVTPNILISISQLVTMYSSKKIIVIVWVYKYENNCLCCMNK